MNQAMNPGQTTTYVCFDPRDPGQSLGDRASWKHTGNAVLISATMLFLTYGGNHPIHWDKVAALASLCECPTFSPTASTELSTLPTRRETNAMLRETLRTRRQSL